MRSTGLRQEHLGETQVSPRALSWRFTPSIKAVYRRQKRREMKEKLIQVQALRESRNRLGPKSKTVSLASDAAFDVRPGSSPQDVARLDMNTIAKSGRTCPRKINKPNTQLTILFLPPLMAFFDSPLFSVGN